MSATREAVVLLAVFKALSDRIKEQDRDVRADAADLLDPGDRKSAVLEDGTDVGTVSMSKPKARVTVTDDRAFLAWVQANAPSEIQSVVGEAYRKGLLARVEVTDEGVVDPKTGEIVDGLGSKMGDPSISVRQTEDQREAVAAAWRDGRLRKALDRALAGVIEA